jgi:hypothetical protein
MRILVVLSLLFMGGAAFANDTELKSYLGSPYSYCDAKILAAYWGQSTWDAKLRIGRKVGWDDQTTVDQMLDTARRQARASAETCDFAETSFTQQDADLLAAYWGVEVTEAKARVGQKMMWGGHQLVRSALDAATRLKPPTATVTFDKCHAKMLAHLWAVNPTQATAHAEQKIAKGYPQLIDSELSVARKLAHSSDRLRCSFWDTPYTYNDAELLAKKWNTTPSNVKATIEQKYINGADPWVASQLIAARQEK